MNTMLSRYDAVLLDIDGTLVDSNGAHAAAWSEAFAAYGRHHPPEQIRPLIGKGGDKLLRELASLDNESGEGKRIGEACVEIFRKRYLPTFGPRTAPRHSSSGSWKAVRQSSSRLPQRRTW